MKADRENRPLLQLLGINKAFPGVQALKKVDFELRPGEVHVLVGENGAGKSTLMKVIAGAHTKDSGRILIDGQEQRQWGPRVSRSKGVAMVYQEFTLVPFRSVAENIFLGREKLKTRVFLDKVKMYREASDQLVSIGIDLDVRLPVMDLGVGEQQMVEIAKALALNGRILVLDEPTSALTVPEIELLFQVIRRLRSKGVGIIYISHRMEEIAQIGDRVTVLRDGEYIGTRNVSEVQLDQIVVMMVGREINNLFSRSFCEPGDVALRVKGLRDGRRLKDVSLEVRHGEVVGLAGLIGSGRTELARAVFGLDTLLSGSIELFGKSVAKSNPPGSLALGVGLLPEDRKRDGLFPILPLKHNVSICSLRSMFRSGFINPKVEQSLAKEYIDKLQIQPSDIERQVKYLSGGNQQKVVIAKWLAVGPKVLIFDEPTRGIDVGAKTEIHCLMNQLVNAGHAILMISSELPEILGMSDRIYVMYEGRIVAEYPQGTGAELIMRSAMGFN